MSNAAAETARVTEPARPIPFVDLQAQRARIAARVDAAIARVLAHGAFIMGPEVAELEARLAEYSGVAHAVSCASGTDALLLPLMAKGIGPGDAVFVPAFTFAATAEVVALLGATPVFVDVLPRSFNIDPASLEAALEMVEGLELTPKGVIAVDLFGQPADYEALGAIAREHGLLVLADAAQSFGATLGNRRAGALGDVAATSFFPAKPLGCYGDGGAIFCDDGELADVVRSLRQHGKGGHKYDIVRVGVNGRLDTIQAAILLEKLAIFPDEIEARQAIAGRYGEGLAGIVEVPRIADGATSAWAQYTVLLEGRDQVAAALKDEGIPTAVYYPKPLNRQTAYAACPVAPAGVPVAERLAARVLSLPMHPYLDEATQDRVIAAVRAAVGTAG